MELCRASRRDVVGLQCNFTTERFRTLRLAERVRREMPEAFVVVGGHDASREPDWFRHPAIDAIAVGDGEEVMPALVDGAGARRRPARRCRAWSSTATAAQCTPATAPDAARPRHPADAGAPPDLPLRARTTTSTSASRWP